MRSTPVPATKRLETVHVVVALPTKTYHCEYAIEMPRMNARDYRWLVYFAHAGHPDDVYSPVVENPRLGANQHSFDPEVTPALGALSYCLHLPRGTLDLLDLPAARLSYEKHLELPHAIDLRPLYVDGDPFSEPVADDTQLIIGPDAHIEALRCLAKRAGVLLGAVSFSELGGVSLAGHWDRLVEAESLDPKHTRPAPSLRDQPPCRFARLPVAWAGRQWSTEEELVELAGLKVDDLVGFARDQWVKPELLVEYLRRGGPPADDAKMSVFLDAVKNSRWHVVVSAAGIPNAVRKRSKDDENPPSEDLLSQTRAIEDEAIRFAVAHRAIARKGVGLELPDIPAEVFEHLRRLETGYRAWKTKPRKLWASFERIGSTLGKQLDASAQNVLRAQRGLTVFSDFPWGLAKVPGHSAPIACSGPIAYRPLTPLTRAIQFECTSPSTFYWGKKIRILLAECIDPNDGAWKASVAGWDSALELAIAESPTLEVRRVQITSPQHLYQELGAATYDALIISAHGVHRPEKGLAGIDIAGQTVVDIECELPPLVIFSACTVWPRGTGAVSVSDLALRRGAVTVLGTLLPVHVAHNAHLMLRLFVYLSESTRRKEPFKTFAEACHHVLVSNAVFDVLRGSPRMLEWGFSPGPNGQPPFEEFMRVRSTGNLHSENIYRNTETILQQIADAHGHQASSKVRSFIKGRSYIPESLFYVMIGWPERIVLQPRFEQEKQLLDEGALLDS